MSDVAADGSKLARLVEEGWPLEGFGFDNT